MAAAADRIIKRVRGKGRGWAFTPKDFLDLGTRASVDMALTRLTQSGQIRRIGRGLYDYPKLHDRFGALTPDADAIAQAVATQGGDKLVRSGAQAANRLGLSTQVPAKASYATSGPTRVKKVAGRTIALKRSRAPILDSAFPRANAVLRARAAPGAPAEEHCIVFTGLFFNGSRHVHHPDFCGTAAGPGAQRPALPRV